MVVGRVGSRGDGGRGHGSDRSRDGHLCLSRAFWAIGGSLGRSGFRFIAGTVQSVLVSLGGLDGEVVALTVAPDGAGEGLSGKKVSHILESRTEEHPGRGFSGDAWRWG